MHELLLRQLNKYLDPGTEIPAQWKALLESVSEAYSGIDNRLTSQEGGVATTAERAELACRVAEHEQAERELRRRNTELDALYETTLRIIDSLDTNNLLEAMLARAAALVGTDHGYIYLSDKAPGRLCLQVAIGVFTANLGYSIGYGQGVAGHVWNTGEALTVADYRTWTRRQHDLDPFNFHAIAGIPLYVGANLVGVIGLAHLEPERTFSPDDLALLTRFGRLAALALGNASLYESLQQELKARERTQEALRLSETKFRSIFENSLDAMFILDDGGYCIDVNPAAAQLDGGPREAMLGKTIFELAPSTSIASLENVWEQFLHDGVVAGEYQLKRHNGEISQLEFRATANYLPGCHIFMLRDITERKSLEQRLRHQAFHDSLTALPNRALFLDRLAQSMARSSRNASSVALIFLDVDDFKVINDSLGHKAGDCLLMQVGERLQACVRAGDSVARLGGDEFTVLLEDIGDLAQARLVAEVIAQQLRAPFMLDGHEVFITASIGISLSSASDEAPDDLLRNADMAMYEAKNKGKARFAVFDPGMNYKAWQRLQMESELRHAIAEGQLSLNYQPVVDLRSGRVVEVEALLRWQHPQHGAVAPADFVPIAESTGLILPIGRWVLQQACRQVKLWQQSQRHEQWHEQHAQGTEPLRLSVNLSAKQFKHDGLLEEIITVLDDTGLDPSCLKLEITEGVALDNSDSTLETLRKLKAAGVRIAVDDFGTGYSALSYLKRYPIDTLKLDRSFVNGLGYDIEDTAIVHAVIAVAQTLGISVTAEGVETVEQLEQLRTLGCDLGQGYYFAHPLPADAVLPLYLQVSPKEHHTGELDLALVG